MKGFKSIKGNRAPQRRPFQNSTCSRSQFPVHFLRSSFQIPMTLKTFVFIFKEVINNRFVLTLDNYFLKYTKVKTIRM